MRDSKIKIRLLFDYEKEETWVNFMSKKGWTLTYFGLVYYSFERGEPGNMFIVMK
ncbi:DUF2812 domain-containing protein [Ureibacillus sp. GCM10028918]|uniref:DUF2812 domain-containing protein n=1 Tax=Ureibacillus sp. GCM10028918 TaxID=3273429 RepID=UPI00360C7579